MTKRDTDIAYFLSFCIEQYKKHISASGNDVMSLFIHYGVDHYLTDNFEILHTQSKLMQNRTQRDFIHEYDIVYGPVANDRVYAAFALYESDLLSKEGLIHELKAYKLVDQFLFHTEKALQHLTFIEAKEVIL